MKTIYPSLLKSSNQIPSFSWFSIYNHSLSHSPNSSSIINSSYIDTSVVVPFFTDSQKKFITSWLSSCISIYNVTNNYIKSNITNNNALKFLNFFSIRKHLNNSIKSECVKTNLNKHTADYAVKHCIEMYKSSFSNKKDINLFNIKDLSYSKRRQNLVIEKCSFSKNKNSFFSSILGNIKTNIPLKNINHNCVLQYDSLLHTYKIIIPNNRDFMKEVKRDKKCGIDIGVRTFLTTYSPENVYEIGSNTNKMIDKMNNKLDNIKSALDNKQITKNTYLHAYEKYSKKMINKINDLHNKAANFLVNKYDTILIGNVSTKKMVNNLTGNLCEIVKRRLMTLSHYRFRMKLKKMGEKYKCKIKEINEYMTTKKCSKCGKKNEVGSKKIYECENKKCKLKIDRDINAAINIYRL